MNTRNLVFLAIWLALIFGTSCTVVRPNEFFQLLNNYVFRDAEGLARFKVLWASIWIFVVKGWHFAEFGVLQVLATRAVDWFRAYRTQANVMVAALCCIIFAASDEWHQTFVQDRFGTRWDVFVDSLGTMTAAYVLARARRPTAIPAVVFQPDASEDVDAHLDRSSVQVLPNSNNHHREREFPFWSVGPITGAFVGLTVVIASFSAWVMHAFPDFLIRGVQEALISAVVMTFGGAIFGIVYGGVLALATRLLDRTIRVRLHFRFAIIVAFVVAYLVSDISLRRKELIGLEGYVALIVCLCFAVGLATAVRKTVPETHLK